MEHRKFRFNGPNHVRCRVLTSVPVELCSSLKRATVLDLNVSAGSPIGWLMQVAIQVSDVLCSLRSAPWLFQSIRRFPGFHSRHASNPHLPQMCKSSALSWSIESGPLFRLFAPQFAFPIRSQSSRVPNPGFITLQRLRFQCKLFPSLWNEVSCHPDLTHALETEDNTAD